MGLPNEKITSEDIVKIFEKDDMYYDTKDSEISKFYAGKSVFVTGGTGFLGKLLVEKLLRACPDINSILMLVRPKKGKDSHTRIDEIFNDVVFEKLSKIQPKFRHKIVLIVGDASLPGLGMSIEDRRLVTEKASIFVHSAATVKFNEKLHLAVDINVKGTREMLNLAKECKNFDSFVHVSTAFSHCPRNIIDEKLYDVPYDADRIIQICNATPPEMLEKITADLLGEWPNTYVFTKAIAEDIIRKSNLQLPICIVRPAIVIPTYKEPLKSWIDNVYGPTGIAVGAGVGLIRVANIDKNVRAEIVPADYVINCIIGACYKTTIERQAEIPIYNYVSSPENVITWSKYMRLCENYGILAPTMRCLWIYSFVLIKNKFLYTLYATLFHMVPAFFMDLGLTIVGKKPQMISVYRKIHVFAETIAYFGKRNFDISNKNTQSLYETLSEADKKLFPFSMAKLNWLNYFKTHCMGFRIYLIKDEVSTIPKAKKRYFRLLLAHKALKIVAFLIILRLVYGLISYLFL